MDKTRKVDVQTASRIFGISPDAVRKRIERKSLRGIKENGVWMVIVEDTKPDKRPESDRTSPENVQTRPDGYEVALTVYKDAIDDMRGHIDTLTEQLKEKDIQIRDLGLELRRKDLHYINRINELKEEILYLSEPKKISFFRRLLSGRTDE